jgi:hypothetical protein
MPYISLLSLAVVGNLITTMSVSRGAWIRALGVVISP